MHKWTKNILPFNIHLPDLTFLCSLYLSQVSLYTRSEQEIEQRQVGWIFSLANQQNNKTRVIDDFGIKSKKRVDEFPWKRHIMQHKVALFKFCSILKTQKYDESRFLNRNIVIHCHTMPIVHIAIVSQ